MPLVYDIQQNFEQNFQRWNDIKINVPAFQLPAKKDWIKFLDFSLATPIGISACPLMLGKGIQQFSQLGFSVLTYKTIRSHASPAHPVPNIVYLNNMQSLTTENLTQPCFATSEEPSPEKMAISNSFGNVSFTPEIMSADIYYAKQSLSKGQILNVSVYGEENKKRDQISDFVYAACLAKEAGADMIELNFSCPNLTTGKSDIFSDSDLLLAIGKKVIQSLGDTPVIIKIGLVQDEKKILPMLNAIARSGANGISAINSISMRVLNHADQPVFGEKRIYSGVSGFPIRNIVLDFTAKLAEINQAQKLGLAILGTGGVTEAKHFSTMLAAGANIALSATGVMWNPYLGIQYLNKAKLCN